MAPPRYDDLRAAALRAIGDGGVHRIRDVIDGIAGSLGVDAADLAALTPKMRRRKFDIDVESAVADLRAAAWLENAGLGMLRITPEGRAVLSRAPKRISVGFLRANSAAFRKREELRRGALGRAGRDGGLECSGIVAAIGVPDAPDSGAGRGGAGAARGGPLSLMRRVRDLLEGEAALGGPLTAAFASTLFVAAEGGARIDLLLALGQAVWPAVTRGIREGIRVDGCVACGRFARPAENWIAGPAADEAAAHYRGGMPRWAGISAAPSAGAALERAAAGTALRGGGGMPYARRGELPGEPFDRGAWAVDWPRLCAEASGGSEVEELAEILDGRIEGARDAGEALRWRNTRRFCEGSLRAS